jgi:hypothetical protein
MAHYRIGDTHIGQFVNGAAIPAGAVECPTPLSGNQVWSGTGWINPVVPITPAQVDAERDRRILEGTIVSVPGIGPVRVEGREMDKENLQGLVMAASLLIGQGAGSEITYFRDADNIMHALTQQQIVALWVASSGFVGNMFAFGWFLKDNPVGIPQDYTDDKYWT